MAYYRRIRDMREDHDLTQRQVAAILQMPQPQYNRYEQGLRDVPTTVLIKLADLYETSHPSDKQTIGILSFNDKIKADGERRKRHLQ